MAHFFSALTEVSILPHVRTYFTPDEPSFLPLRRRVHDDVLPVAPRRRNHQENNRRAGLRRRRWRASRIRKRAGVLVPAEARTGVGARVGTTLRDRARGSSSTTQMVFRTGESRPCTVVWRSSTLHPGNLLLLYLAPRALLFLTIIELESLTKAYQRATGIG